MNKISKIHSMLQNDKCQGARESKGGGQEVAVAQGEGELEELEMSGYQITGSEGRENGRSLFFTLVAFAKSVTEDEKCGTGVELCV